MIRLDHLKDRNDIVNRIQVFEKQGEAGINHTKASAIEHRTLKHLLRIIDSEIQKVHREYKEVDINYDFHEGRGENNKLL